MKACQKCGQQNDDTVNFCGKCGNDLRIPAPVSKKSKAPVVMLVVVVVAFALVYMGSAFVSNRRLPAAKAYQVEYWVDGDGLTADLTYRNAQGDTSQQGGASLPWTKTFTAHSGDRLSVNAQGDGNNAGIIQCKITVDGAVKKTNKSSGRFSIVDCSVTLP